MFIRPKIRKIWERELTYGIFWEYFQKIRRLLNFRSKCKPIKWKIPEIQVAHVWVYLAKISSFSEISRKNIFRCSQPENAIPFLNFFKFKREFMIEWKAPFVYSIFSMADFTPSTCGGTLESLQPATRISAANSGVRDARRETSRSHYLAQRSRTFGKLTFRALALCRGGGSGGRGGGAIRRMIHEVENTGTND